MMLTQRQVHEALHYDPTTGVLTRAARTSNRIKEGQRAGSVDAKGYLCIRVAGKTHKAHRLAWLHFYGHWPVGEVDHINGVKDDNRICNLRDVPKSINQQNRRAVRGYSKDGTRWKAQIRAAGKHYHLGNFATERDAHAAYLVAKETLHMKAREA